MYQLNEQLFMTKFAETFKILGEKHRLGIISLLSHGEKCVCNIYKELGISQNLTSHHLSILRESNLITARKEGKWVYYSLNTKKIEELEQFLNKILLTEKKKTKC